MECLSFIELIVGIASGIAIPLIIFFIGKKYSQVSLMLQLRSMISSAKNITLNNLPSDGVDESGVFFAALEDAYNAYEEACACYVYNKVPKRYFEAVYSREIKKNVESDNMKKKFKESDCQFPYMAKVYKKWFPEGILKE